MVNDAVLAGIPFLASASAAARREISARGRLVEFAPDAVLFREGTVPPGIFVILHGSVRVVHSTSNGRQHVVHEEGPGGSLAELPVFEGGVTPASAIAVQRTECLLIPTDALWAALAADSSLAAHFLKHLAARVRTLVERLERMTSHSVASRLAL